MLQEARVTQAQFLIVSFTIIGLPLFYFPFLGNSSDLPKQLLLIGSSAALLFLAWIKLMLTKKLTLLWSFPIVSLLGLTLLAFGSLMLHQGQKMLSLTHPFGGLTILALFIFAFFASSLSRKEEFQAKLRIIFLTSSIAAGAASLLWMAGQIVPSIQILPWHLSGNAKSALLLQWLPITLVLPPLLTVRKTLGAWPAKITAATASALCIALLTTILMFVRFQSISMPTTLGWQVAMEALKIKPLDGVGPLNYEHLFVQSRPATLNISPLWNVRFLSAPNFLLHTLSIYGGVGVVLMLLLAFLPLLQNLKKPITNLVPPVAVLLALIFGPPDLLVFFAIMVASVFLSWSFRIKDLSFLIKEALLALTIILPIGYLMSNLFIFGPVVQTENLLSRASNLLTKNQPENVSSLVFQAQKLTPYRDDLAAFTSQLMLQNLLNSLKNQSNLSAEFQSQVMEQINATINMAQQAIVLNPLSSSNWKNLADVYARLRPYVDNADAWSIRTLEQTVMRDPSNAFVKAQIADVFYAQGNTLRALQMLESAVSLKPDYPPFMYALARLYVQIQDFGSAKQALLQTQRLLPEKSEDQAIIQRDLEQLEQVLNNPQTPAAPQASPSAQVQPAAPQTSPKAPLATPKPSKPTTSIVPLE